MEILRFTALDSEDRFNHLVDALSTHYTDKVGVLDGRLLLLLHDGWHRGFTHAELYWDGTHAVLSRGDDPRAMSLTQAHQTLLTLVRALPTKETYAMHQP